MLSAIVPAFEIKENYVTYYLIKGNALSKMMDIDTSDIVFYRIEKVSEEDIKTLIDNGEDVGFRVKSYQGLLGHNMLAMNMKKILSFLEENKQLRVQVDRLKDSVIGLTDELNNLMKEPLKNQYTVDN